ncbi:MAG: hypothetical protein JWO53_915 [Chlamydiia bacterium]|nr:hypothetical protein [Chlamydiia bacterium]
MPPLWEKFFQENIAEKITNRTNQNLLAVYTAYEGDYMKPFTYIIACEVSSLDVIPEGLIGKEIASSSYAVFTAKGLFPQSMMQAWQKVWNANITRAYRTDFEVYSPDFNPQASPEVKIYVSIQ